MQDPSCRWKGFEYYEGELKRWTVKYPRERILFLGDSMGGTAALLFSHLAARTLAFVPQVEIHGYSQATREDLTSQRCKQHTAHMFKVRTMLAL